MTRKTYHGLCHTVANKQNNVLGLAFFCGFADGPTSDRLLTVVVLQFGGVLPRLFESELRKKVMTQLVNSKGGKLTFLYALAATFTMTGVPLSLAKRSSK
jgi:hypothetical protein